MIIKNKNIFLPMLLAFMLLNTSICVAQFDKAELEDAILKNFYPIVSFDINKNELFESKHIDFSKNTRVIQLGENTHGDGTTFKLKTELIKYLHEKEGFNVFIFESGWFEMLDVQKKLSEKQGALKAIENNIYDIYMCQEVLDLFTYIQSTYNRKSPIKVYGLDPQMSSYSSGERQFKEITSLVKTLFPNKDLSNELKNLYEVLHYIQSLGRMKISDDLYNDFEEFATRIIKKMSESDISMKDRLFWKNTFQNLTTMANVQLTRSMMPALNSENFNEIINSPIYIEAGNYRDRQMAKNVLTIVNDLEKDEKIIVWAANSHIFTSNNDNNSEINKITMGMELKEELGTKMKTVAALANSGSWQIVNKPYQKGSYTESSKESVFKYLKSVHAENGIINLDNIMKSKEFANSPKFKLTDELSMKDFSKKCNYILFVQSMEPTIPIIKTEGN